MIYFIQYPSKIYLTILYFLLLLRIYENPLQCLSSGGEVRKSISSSVTNLYKRRRIQTGLVQSVCFAVLSNLLPALRRHNIYSKD